MIDVVDRHESWSEQANVHRSFPQAETRKSELETLLSTNLVRRQQELEAHYASIDPQAMSTQFEMKRQELSDAKAAVDEANGQLKCKSVPFSLD